MFEVEEDSNASLVMFMGRIGLGLLYMKLIRSLYNIFYPYVFGRPRDLHQLSGDTRWALVTGATDGIGKAYAAELARRGFNLVLISRSAAKLESVSEELKQSVGREAGNDLQIRTVQFDFTNAKLADYEERVFPHLNDIDIGILVNNVGMGNADDYPERMDKIALKWLADMTIVNTLPATILSAFVLPKMVKRDRGVIVNIASSGSYMPWYHYAVYSSTKKYITHLSSVLRKEYAVDAPGVHIQAVCPMLVATKMAQRTNGGGFFLTSLLTASPTHFARQALRSVGLAQETAGCLLHQIQVEIVFNFLYVFLPASIFDYFMRWEINAHKRALNMATKKE